MVYFSKCRNEYFSKWHIEYSESIFTLLQENFTAISQKKINDFLKRFTIKFYSLFLGK